VRQATTNALGFIGDRSAVEALCELVGDPDRDVRESVISALGHIADKRAIVPLVPALLDAESTVRSAATATLQKLDRHWEQNEGISAVVPKIVKALDHQDYWVRYSAGKLLELLKIDPKQLPAEPAPVEPEKPPEKIPVHPALNALADLLFDRDRDLRLAAATALGQLREKSAGELLAAAARDSDFAVRQAAQAALAALN
jgi:HEAT repeat protein